MKPKQLAEIRAATVHDREGGKEGRSSVNAKDVEDLLAERDRIAAALRSADNSLMHAEGSMPDVLSASQLADERAAHRAEVAALVQERDEARQTNTRLNRRCQEAERAARDTLERAARSDMCFGRALANWGYGQETKRAETALAQRDAWSARYTDLATAVLEGVYLNYDVKEDSGGSSFLCTCEHDGDGWPHDQDCGALLTSTLPADAASVAAEDRAAEVRLRGDAHIEALEREASWNPDDLRSPDASCEEADLPAEERALLPDNDEAQPA